MYRIKAKPGFNIIIKDLNLSLRSETKGFISISKEAFDASRDAQSVLNYIIVEGAENAVETVTVTADATIQQTAEGAFVRAGHLQTNPDDVFVAQPKSSPETLSRATIQADIAPVFIAQPIVEETPVKDEAPAFIANPVEAKEVQEEIKPEVKEEVKTAVKETKVKVETAKKPGPKKTTDKKK